MTNQLIRTCCLFVCLAVFSLLTLIANAASEKEGSEGFYLLTAKDLAGKEVSFDEFRGKVVLVSNISLLCGTTPQLKDLETLYEKYRERGFVVLGFPSDDFTGKKKHDADKIKGSCRDKFGVSFPLFELTPVKGPKKHPVFAYLTAQCADEIEGEVMFNFEKFLVSKNGKVTERYGSFTNAMSERLTEDVERLLKE